jgi:hypothetical protein
MTEALIKDSVFYTKTGNKNNFLTHHYDKELAALKIVQPPLVKKVTFTPTTEHVIDGHYWDWRLIQNDLHIRDKVWYNFLELQDAVSRSKVTISRLCPEGKRAEIEARRVGKTKPVVDEKKACAKQVLVDEKKAYVKQVLIETQGVEANSLNPLPPTTSVNWTKLLVDPRFVSLCTQQYRNTRRTLDYMVPPEHKKVFRDYDLDKELSLFKAKHGKDFHEPTQEILLILARGLEPRHFVARKIGQYENFYANHALIALEIIEQFKLLIDTKKYVTPFRNHYACINPRT